VSGAEVIGVSQHVQLIGVVVVAIIVVAAVSVPSPSVVLLVTFCSKRRPEVAFEWFESEFSAFSVIVTLVWAGMELVLPSDAIS